MSASASQPDKDAFWAVVHPMIASNFDNKKIREELKKAGVVVPYDTWPRGMIINKRKLSKADLLDNKRNCRGQGKRPRVDAKHFHTNKQKFSDLDVKLLWHSLLGWTFATVTDTRHYGRLQKEIKTQGLTDQVIMEALQERVPPGVQEFARAFAEWHDLSVEQAAKVVQEAADWDDCSSVNRGTCDICSAELGLVSCFADDGTGEREGTTRVCRACEPGVKSGLKKTNRIDLKDEKMRMRLVSLLRAAAKVPRISAQEVSSSLPYAVSIPNLPDLVPETVETNLTTAIANGWFTPDSTDTSVLRPHEYTQFNPVPASDKRSSELSCDDFTVKAQLELGKLMQPLQPGYMLLYAVEHTDSYRHALCLVTAGGGLQHSLGTGDHMDSSGAWNVATLVVPREGWTAISPRPLPGTVLAVWVFIVPEHADEALRGLYKAAGVDPSLIGSTVLLPSAEVLDNFCEKNPSWVVRIEQESGVAVRVPSGWWHLVSNRAPNAKLAIETCEDDQEVTRAAWGRNQVRAYARGPSRLSPRELIALGKKVRKHGHTLTPRVLPLDYFSVPRILYDWIRSILTAERS